MAHHCNKDRLSPANVAPGWGGGGGGSQSSESCVEERSLKFGQVCEHSVDTSGFCSGRSVRLNHQANHL